MSTRHRIFPLLGFGLIAAAASPIGADTLGFHHHALKREFADYQTSQATLPPGNRNPQRGRGRHHPAVERSLRDRRRPGRR
ncbi:MAG: hypothetical protein ACPW60_13020 [Methylohalobius sp. ZOD2]